MIAVVVLTDRRCDGTKHKILLSFLPLNSILDEKYCVVLSSSSFSEGDDIPLSRFNRDRSVGCSDCCCCGDFVVSCRFILLVLSSKTVVEEDCLRSMWLTAYYFYRVISTNFSFNVIIYCVHDNISFGNCVISTASQTQRGYLSYWY